MIQKEEALLQTRTERVALWEEKMIWASWSFGGFCAWRDSEIPNYELSTAIWIVGAFYFYESFRFIRRSISMTDLDRERNENQSKTLACHLHLKSAAKRLARRSSYI